MTEEITTMKHITHSSLLESGFELVWFGGSRNIYELNGSNGRVVRIGEHNDKNEDGKYWVYYDGVEDNLKSSEWNRLAGIVKSELNIEL